MPASKAQQRAVNKYMAANYDRITLTVKKGQRAELQAIAAEHGESLNAFIKRNTGNLPFHLYKRLISESVNCTIKTPAADLDAPQAPGASLDPETLNAAQAAADAAGEYLSAFLRRAIETQAQRDKVLRTVR